ncbi:gp6-like head-tail connector protein [Cereibacter ovatus]|uniref:Gp6-like head-tail connector protein n=1 Tax=Cereibacter ovatus TaxID=439529 RepID=A0A285D6J3_9RHOB|nr:head-tail connector protein [Cereibacter ovatus]SNX75275.1 gp6-like head-tail connector protein [Cereibacter ovatus]
MAIVDLGQLKAHLNITDLLGDEDDALLSDKLDAAQGHIERPVGYKIDSRFGGADQEPVPPSLAQAVLMLAAWWYDQRESAVVGSGATLEVKFITSADWFTDDLFTA